MEESLWHYRAFDLSAVDADTVDMTVDLGFGVTRRDRFRLYGPDPAGKMGLDAPELSTPEGKAARDWLRALLAEPGAVFHIRTVKDRREKYGRYLAVVFLTRPDGQCDNVNGELVRTGHAALRAY